MGEVIFSVKDQVCLVTGGAAGLGANIVKALLHADAQHVAFLDIAEREGTVLETQLNNTYGGLRAKFIKCDVSNKDELNSAYEQVLDKYRRLEVVINNAGLLCADEMDRTRMVDVNFTATMNSTYRALDIMSVDKGGCGGIIINISSLLGLNLNNVSPVYSATKTAILQFTNCIGMEPQYSKTQVRILTVCPGPMDTAILHKHNMQNFDKECETYIKSCSFARQRVESAASGILDVIKRGQNGSTWRVANDKPAQDITEQIRKVYGMINELLHNE